MAAPAPTQYTQQSIGFADQIAPYAEKLLGTAELYTDINENPYQQYMRDRQAQFTPLQQQAFENAGLMQTLPGKLPAFGQSFHILMAGRS